MNQKRHRLVAFIISMVLAQIAVNVPVWSISGQAVPSRLYLAVLSGVAVIFFPLVARYFGDRAARDDAGGREGSPYLEVLLIATVYTLAEPFISIFVPLGRHVGSNQFSWTTLTVGLIVVLGLSALTAVYVSDAYDTSRALELLSRLFRQPLSPEFGVPGPDLSERDFAEAVPREYPRTRSRDARRDEGPKDRRRGELDATLARGTAWAEGLLTVSDEIRRGPTPEMTTVGFVQLRRQGIQLAVINYFRPRRLLLAWFLMPRRVQFEGVTFPVVARPWLPVQHRADAPGKRRRTLWTLRGTADAAPADLDRVESADRRKAEPADREKEDRTFRPALRPRTHVPDRRRTAIDGHCWVAVGGDPERCGVVTALHTVVPADSAIDDHVSIATSRTRINGILRQVSKELDTALIELSDTPRPRLAAAAPSPEARFGRIRLCAGHHDIDGLVIELAKVADGAQLRNAVGSPMTSAHVFLNVSGAKGDSGCLVLDMGDGEEESGAPYLMYQWVLQLSRTQQGAGVLLHQIASDWEVSTQFNRSPGLPSGSAIPEVGA